MVSGEKLGKKAAFAILFAMLLALAGCSFFKPAEKKAPIKLAIDPWIGNAGGFIAKDRGYFEKNGVEVELVLTDSAHGKELYSQGDVDGVFEVYSDAIFQNAQGTSGKVVYVMDYSEKGDAIVAKQGITTVEGLRGKKIGVEGINSFSHMFVLSVLEKHNVSESEVYIENVPGADAIEALDSGKVDACHTWNPTKNKAIKKGYVSVATAQETPGLMTDVLVVSPKITSERWDEIKAIVKSLAEAQEFLAENRKEAAKIMAKSMGTSEEEAELEIGETHFLTLGECKIAMSSGTSTTSLYQSGDVTAKFFISRGQMSNEPDFKKIIDRSFVDSISRGWNA